MITENRTPTKISRAINQIQCFRQHFISHVRNYYWFIGSWPIFQRILFIKTFFPWTKPKKNNRAHILKWIGSFTTLLFFSIFTKKFRIQFCSDEKPLRISVLKKTKNFFFLSKIKDSAFNGLQHKMNKQNAKKCLLIFKIILVMRRLFTLTAQN